MRRAWFHFYNVLLCAGAVCLAAEDRSTAVKLTGIINIQTKKCVLLETTKAGPGKPGPVIRSILSEGDLLGDVEVVAINEQTRQVKLSVAGKETVLTLESPSHPPGTAKASTTPITDSGTYSLQLRGASLGQVLEIFQSLSGRTVLRSRALPDVRLDVDSGRGLPATDAVNALDTALGEKGLAMERYGDKFVLAMPQADVERLTALLGPAVSATTPSPAMIKEGTIPPGEVRFTEADLTQVLEVYQEISGRTLLRAPVLPNAPVTVKTQTALKRAEVVNMLDTLLALNGVSMVPQGDKFVFVVPSAQLDRLTALLARFSLAPFAPPAVLTPVASDKGTGEATIAASAINLQEAELSRTLEEYDALTGRKVEPAPNVPTIRITLRARTPLTRNELIYAFDMVLGLHNLALIPQGGNTFKLLPSAELDRKPNPHKP